MLEIIIVLLIILFFVQSVLKAYYTKSAPHKEIEKIATDAGINTTSYKSIVESTRGKVQGLLQERQEALGEFTE